LNCDTSNSVTRRTAETPLIILFQQASFPMPLGETMPAPVTTTLRLLLFINQLPFIFPGGRPPAPVTFSSWEQSKNAVIN